MTPADWQLPPGTDRGVWDYLHHPTLAADYDESLAGSPLLQHDLRFAEHWFPTPGRLVDLGCGTGRLLIPFAERGFECLGVDLSAKMLERVAAKIADKPWTVWGMKANLVELNAIVDGSFDYAACLFSTLGMIRGADHRRRMLEQVHRILRPQGRLILHVHNRWYRFGRGSGRRGPELGDRTMPQHYGGADLTLHHFTRKETVDLLHATRFRILECRRVSATASGVVRFPWWFGFARTYGYLFAVERMDGFRHFGDSSTEG